MTKYTKIWVNGTQKVLRQSYSLDRFDKRAVKKAFIFFGKNLVKLATVGHCSSHPFLTLTVEACDERISPDILCRNDELNPFLSFYSSKRHKTSLHRILIKPSFHNLQWGKASEEGVLLKPCIWVFICLF